MTVTPAVAMHRKLGVAMHRKLRTCSDDGETCIANCAHAAMTVTRAVAMHRKLRVAMHRKLRMQR